MRPTMILVVGTIFLGGPVRGEEALFRHHQEPNPFRRFFSVLAEIPEQLVELFSREWRQGNQGVQDTILELRDETRDDAEATKENLQMVPDLLYRQVPEDEERLGGALLDLSRDARGQWEDAVDTFIWLWE